MAIWRRRVPVPRRAASVGVNGPFDLSVNPISYLVLHVDGLVAAATAVGVRTPFTDITNVTVAHQGASVVNLSGADLQACAAVFTGSVPYVLNHASIVNGDVVRVSLVIPFSRRLFWQNECFPATRKGDLTMSVTFGAEGATFQSRNFSVEAIELPGAAPERFLKMVSLTRALTATDFDLPLPIGNTYAGIVLNEPVLMDAGITSGTIRTVTLLQDHREEWVIASRYEALRDAFERRLNNFDEYTATALPALGNYGLIDLSPLHDDTYLLESGQFEDLRLRFELDNAGAPRVIPLELVKVPGAPAPGA